MKLTGQRNKVPYLLTATFLIALALFILLAIYVKAVPQNSFDQVLQKFFLPLGAGSPPGVMLRLTFFGSFEFLFPAYVIFILMLVFIKKARYGISVAGVSLGGFLSVELLKQLFHRHRPPVPLIPNVTDYSFPSGHSTSSLIFCTVMSYSLWHTALPCYLRLAAVVFFGLLALSIGISRIVLTVHYPTDVAAGFCFGTLWVLAWYQVVHKRLYRRLPDLSETV